MVENEVKSVIIATISVNRETLDKFNNLKDNLENETDFKITQDMLINLLVKTVDKRSVIEVINKAKKHQDMLNKTISQ